MKLFNRNISKEMKSKDVTWKELVKEGVELLVKEDIATQDLEKAILKSTEEHGAYYVLEKGIALLHAPVGEYCKKPGTSLILLDENVQFNDEDKWARIIITLSAIDSNSHISLIQEFGRIFTDEELKKKILSAKNLDELFDLYEKGGS